MTEEVDRVFEPLVRYCRKAGLTDELVGLTELSQSRAQELVDMGKDPNKFASAIAKGVHLDAAVEFLVGLIRSSFFGAAALVAEKVPAFTEFSSSPAKQGLAVGAFFHAVDYGGVQAILPVLNDTLWLDRGEGPSALEAILDRLQPSAGARALELAGPAQTFSARNVLKVIAPFLSPEISPVFLTLMGSAGSAVAGAFMRLFDHMKQRDAHRLGAAVMLARDDWKERYSQLENYHPVAGPVMGIGKRLARVPREVCLSKPLADAAASLFHSDSLAAGAVLVGAIVANIVAVLASLLRSDSLASGAVLVGGIVANTVAVSAVNTSLQANTNLKPVTKGVLEQLTNLATMAPVYSLWAMLGVISQPELVKPVATKAYKGVQEAIGSAWTATANAGRQAWPDRGGRLAAAQASSSALPIVGASPSDMALETLTSPLDSVVTPFGSIATPFDPLGAQSGPMAVPSAPMLVPSPPMAAPRPARLSPAEAPRLPEIRPGSMFDPRFVKE